MFEENGISYLPNIIKPGLTERDLYARLVSCVGDWNPKLDPDPKELYLDCNALLQKTRDTSMYPYAINLTYFFLGKAGHQYRIDKKINLGPLRAISETKHFYDGVDHSAASKWILARICAADIPFKEDHYEKYHLNKDASILFSGIVEPVNYKFPVLLPGIKSESIPENILGEFSKSQDPATYKLPIPHRYIAAFYLNLAHYKMKSDPTSASAKLEAARFHCATSIRENNGVGHDFLLINIEHANCMIDICGHLINNSSANKVSLINRLESILNRIENAAKNYKLPTLKAHEWIAAIYAAMAALNHGNNSRANYLGLFYKKAEEAIKLHEGGADSFLIDIIYRMAHKEGRETDEYVKWVRNCQLANRLS